MRAVARRIKLFTHGECISKKARSLDSSEQKISTKQKTQIVLELRQQYPIMGLLKVAGLARSTFYYQLNGLQKIDKYATLKAKIKTIFTYHKGRYGYRRITSVLRQESFLVNHKTVQRLMGQLQLKSLVRPKKYRSYKGSIEGIAPNFLQQQFSAQRPNQKWVTDVTEFHVYGQKLYLSPIMDLYNGEIISYQIAPRPTLAMVSTMLSKAFTCLGPDDKLIMHSDQGWQYQMAVYREELAQKGITQSMSRKGNGLDNAAMESFFATIKSEFFYLNKFCNIDELQVGLSDYIHYYNHERIKLRLDGLSPVQYRLRSQPFYS
ncbi:IS3 family transposase [Mycoavidus cysteinexigens]|uniref:IS3 family transposase n=1 Tax=Mycoavidus cysteinexigens TaxID=1553431 RepID=UPI0026B366DF